MDRYWHHVFNRDQILQVGPVTGDPLSEVTTRLCFGTSVVDQTPDQCQDSGITLHLPQKTQKTSPRPRIARLPPKRLLNALNVNVFTYYLTLDLT